MRHFIPYHSPSLFDRAEKASNNMQGIEAAILSVATAEAFLHDLTEWLGYAVDHKAICKNKNKDNSLFRASNNANCFSKLHKITEIEVQLYSLLLDLEKQKKQADYKYKKSANFLKSNVWSKGGKPLQDYLRLVRIRNNIIHIKGSTFVVEDGKVANYPSFVQELIASKAIRKPSKVESWLELLDSVEFCGFCIRTVRLLIESFHELLPDNYMSNQFKAGTKL